MSPSPESVAETAAKNEWPRWKSDCSGFAHAMASDLGLELSGNANGMFVAMAIRANDWIDLGHDPKLAIGYANRGFFMVAGLKAEHGRRAVLLGVANDAARPGSMQTWPRSWKTCRGGTF